MSTGRPSQTGARTIPPDAGLELSGAIEAATGQAADGRWRDPLDQATLRSALDQLLIAHRPDRGLELLVRTGVLGAVLPEVVAMVGFGEGIRHKDVWQHTLKVIRQTPPRLAVRWAALLHDIGKVPTRRFQSDGQVTFIGHPEVGARMFDRIARRLPFEPPLYERVRFLIAAHLRASAYDPAWTDSAVRRFARDAGDRLEDLLDLSRGDITSKYAEKVRRGLEQIDALAERVRRVQEEDSRPAPLPKGLGTVLIERFSITPGPGLGQLMKMLMLEVEEGRLGVQEDFDHYVSYLEGNPTLLEEALRSGR
jgi:poly(A) polymerase